MKSLGTVGERLFYEWDTDSIAVKHGDGGLRTDRGAALTGADEWA